jgi:hypothetical protein
MELMPGAVLIYRIVAYLAVALVLSTPAAAKGNDRCWAYCGTRLKIVSGHPTPICQACGRQQPGNEELLGHGRH